MHTIADVLNTRLRDPGNRFEGAGFTVAVKFLNGDAEISYALRNVYEDGIEIEYYIPSIGHAIIVPFSAIKSIRIVED